MKCPFCGSDNRDDAAYCKTCEKPLCSEQKERNQLYSRLLAVITARISRMESTLRSVRIEQHAQSVDVERLPNTACPHCGNSLQGCTPVSKTTVTDSRGGYGFFRGCCGMIFLGPLGLLCGLRKRSTTSSSQTWWVCKNCGKEFVEKEAAKEIVNESITSAAVTTLVIALIWQFVFAVIGYSHWVRDIAVLMIVGTWVAFPAGIKESTGYTIKQLLTPEERVDFYKQCALYGIGGFLLGAVVGAKVMGFFFS